MGFAFRAMVWMIAFNLAVGITIFAFGQQAWLLTPGALPPDTGINQVNQLDTAMSGSSGVPVEETSFWYRFMDIISLGMFNRVKDFLNTTIFSIPTLLNRMGILPEGLMPYANGGILLICILGMIEIFTGKDLTMR
jgi:hypothetical protein